MKIRGLSEENFFEEISVSKAANRHSVCKIRQRLADENFAAYQNAVGKTVSVELDSGRPIFFGEVAEVFIEQTFRGSYVEVTAVSFSQKNDAAAVTRIFQKPAKVFGEILNSARLKLQGSELVLEEKFAAKPCREIILQNGETDFEFMRRLAEWQGRRVWVQDTWQSGCKLKIAARSDESEGKISQNEIISLKIGRRGKIRTAELVARKYFELGRVLNLAENPSKFLIVALEVYEDGGAERVRFELEEFLEPALAAELRTPLVKLRAKVLETADGKNLGRIRVQFEVEDMDAQKSWLPYRTPYSGIIFLPEIGDTVEVFYSGGECYVGNILRTAPLDAEFRNVVDKYLGNNRRQRIFFREKSLEIKSLETSILLDEKKIELTAGANKIILDERGITLKTGGAFLSEVAKDFTSKAGGKIALDGGGNVAVKSGGKFEASASGVAAIKGSAVELG